MRRAPPEEIRTERLLLRPQRLGDAEAVTELASRRRIAATTLNVPHPYTLEDAVRWIEQCDIDRSDGRSFSFAVTDRATGRLVGAIGLHVEPDESSGELGYWIGVPFWGLGYATEAARAMIELGFCSLDLDRICGRHFADNPASGRVLEKAGLRIEHLLRGDVLKWDERKDVAVYGLRRSDYHRPENR